MTIELQTTPVITSNIPVFDVDGDPFWPDGSAVPEFFRGHVECITCEIYLNFLPRFLARYGVRWSVAGEYQEPHP